MAVISGTKRKKNDKNRGEQQMVKQIIKDILFLGETVPATEADKQVAIDLSDTLKANREHCVRGMAANMIGVKNASLLLILDLQIW